MIGNNDINKHFIDQFIKYNGEPNYVKIQRLKAQEKFKQLLLPTKNNELYKYTDIVNPLYNVKNDSEIIRNNHNEELIQIKSTNSITIKDGILEEVNVNSPKQLLIKRVVELPENYESSHLEKFFNAESLDNIKDPMMLLNMALSKDIIFINIPSETNEETLIINYIHNSLITHPRILINIEGNSNISIIQNFAIPNKENNLINNNIEVELAANSELTHYVIQNCSESSNIINNSIYNVNKNGKLNTFNISLNGSLIRNNTHTNLNEAQSLLNMYGLYIINNNIHIDNNTNINHNNLDTHSNQLYKGIISKGTGVFNGKIYVKKDSQKITAFQSNKNILISEDAKIYTKPQLEIYADDVKCSHGATIGQIDDEQIFYMQSRGIDNNTAKSIFLSAFSEEIISKIKTKNIKESIVELVDNQISTLPL